jgi:predicted lipoprotein
MSRLGESLALVAIAVAAVSCSGDDSSSGGGGGGGDQGRRGEVLAALGEAVVLPAIVQFESDAKALEAALAEATTAPGGRDAAQAVWIDTLGAWQQLEVMQFGPLGSSLTVMGGQDLRARIYSWPLGSRCAVDRETVGESYDDPDALDQIPGVPTGLWAIEYLLFTDDPDNGCTEFDSINSEGTWDSMADMIPQRRLDYAASLGTLVRRWAEELATAWSPEGGNFIEELTDPGRNGAVYGTAQEGLNAVSDAMFYLEKETKDMKLGKPLGITGCSTQQCPEALESPWALRSKEHVLANLAGFQSLFLGGTPADDALGFDDLLRDMGADDVADDMADTLTAAISATESVPGTFRDALTENEEELRAAHTAIQAVTDILKTDFLSVLDLEAPDRAAGDND